MSEAAAPSTWLAQTSPWLLERFMTVVDAIVARSRELERSRRQAAIDIAMDLADTWYPYARKRGDLFLDTLTCTRYGVSAMQVETDHFGIRAGEVALPVHTALSGLCLALSQASPPDTHEVEESVWKARRNFAVWVGYYLARGGDDAAMQGVLAHANADD